MNKTIEELKIDLKMFQPLSVDDVGVNGNYAKLVRKLIDENPSNINLIPIEILGKGQEVLTNSFFNPKQTTIIPLLNFSDYSELAKYAMDRGANIKDLHQDYIVSNYLEIFETLSKKIQNIYENDKKINKFEALSSDIIVNTQSKDFDVIR